MGRAMGHFDTTALTLVFEEEWKGEGMAEKRSSQVATVATIWPLLFLAFLLLLPFGDGEK